jgi:CHASE2 domain-containing sensor protein
MVALIVAASYAGTSCEHFPGEDFSLDARFALRGERALRGEVAIIAIDDHTLRTLGTTWPFSRAILGEAIDRLTELGAKVIGVDILLTEPQHEPGADAALAEAVKRSQRVVLISQVEYSRVSAGASVTLAGKSLLLPMPELLSAARATGYYNFPADTDGVVRRATPLRRHHGADGGEQTVVSLATALTVSALGVSTNAAEIVDGELRARGTPVRMPLDRRGSFLIDFQGGAGHVPTYSLDRLLKRQLSADSVAGRIVIIGPTFRTSKDFLRTSASGLGEREMPGVEVHANAATQLLGGQAFSWASRTLLAVIYPVLLTLVSLAAWLGLMLARRRGSSTVTSLLFGLPGPALIVTGYLAVVQGAFNAYMALPVAAPLVFSTVLVALVLIGSLAADEGIAVAPPASTMVTTPMPAPANATLANATPATPVPVPVAISAAPVALPMVTVPAPVAPAPAPVAPVATPTAPAPVAITPSRPAAASPAGPTVKGVVEIRHDALPTLSGPVGAPLSPAAAAASSAMPSDPEGLVAASGERSTTHPEPEALAQTMGLPNSPPGTPAGPGPSVRFSAQRPLAQLPQLAQHRPATEPTEPALPSPDMPRARRFEFRRLLGRGGMGSVYEGHDRILDEPVAIKLMLRAALQDTDMFERFLREVKLARRVTHPNVARVYDFVEEEGQQFIAMELLQGQTLRSRNDASKLPPVEAVKVAREVARGLEAVHKVGVIHRDLKPDNIMLVPGRGAVVMDFGVARGTDQLKSTSTGAMIGTPQYMSPEQFHGQPVDARSDLYSLGLILYEMLEGQVPLTGRTVVEIALRRMSQPAPPLKAVPELSALVGRLLSAPREGRPGSAAEVADELDRWLASAR